MRCKRGARVKVIGQSPKGKPSSTQPAACPKCGDTQLVYGEHILSNKVTSPAWKTKPIWYMVATADRSINPDQERIMAKRAKAKTIEVNPSHVAYMSHPKETAKLIEEAANSAHVN